MPTREPYLDVECLSCGRVERITGVAAVIVIAHLQHICLALGVPPPRPDQPFLFGQCRREACISGEIDLEP